MRLGAFRFFPHYIADYHAADFASRLRLMIDGSMISLGLQAHLIPRDFRYFKIVGRFVRCDAENDEATPISVSRQPNISYQRLSKRDKVLE